MLALYAVVKITAVKKFYCTGVRSSEASILSIEEFSWTFRYGEISNK
jgi:hypothetical protein